MSHILSASSAGLKQLKDSTKPDNHLELQVDGVTKLTVTPTGLVGDFGTGGGSAPVAFGAYQSVAQSIVNSTPTKVTFGVEEYDTDNCYDIATSIFTPPVKGIYHFDWRIKIAAPTQANLDSGLVSVATGNALKKGDSEASAQSQPASCGSVNVKLEAGQQVIVQVNHVGTSAVSTTLGADVTWFSGFLVRAL